MRFLKDLRQVSGGRARRFAGASMLAALVTLATASMAPASSHHPRGEFASFGECPLNRTVITDCIFAVVKGGSLTLGSKMVPIKNPLTFQGGFSGGGSEINVFGAENGETISKTPQPIPADVIGVAPSGWPKSLQSWFNENIRKTGVTATVELAAPATSIKLSTENLIFEEGIALQLPIKVKLVNPLLGSACYLGSDKNPIMLPLSAGTSGKLKGFAGGLTSNDAVTLITLDSARLVNSTFATGAVSGCGGAFSAFVNPLINSIFGASPSGKNFITLEVKLQDAAAKAVRDSE